MNYLKYYLIGFVFCCCSSLFSFCQPTKALSPSVEQIIALKKGVLIVRLPSSENKLRALTLQGKFTEASELKNEIAQNRKKLISAFRTTFDFCSVYFISSDKTALLLDGLKSGFFLNDSAKIDSTLSLSESPFFVCDVGEINLPKLDGSVTGLCIRDSLLNLLEPPFPYFVRDYASFPGLAIESKEKLIAIWNENLHEYYTKVSKKYKLN